MQFAILAYCTIDISVVQSLEIFYKNIAFYSSNFAILHNLLLFSKINAVTIGL